jgi:ABC-type transporter Mla subunit MlaD
MSGRLGGTNARDIRQALQGNTDPKLVKIIADLADRQDHLFQLMHQLAKALDVLTDGQLAMARATDTLRTEHERIKKAKSMGVVIETEIDRDSNG